MSTLIKKSDTDSATTKHCNKCKAIFDYVWVVTHGKEFCFDCFEKLYPRMASVNRLKKSGEQLEMILHD